MSSTTKIEQNAVNEVRNFIDTTDILRSYLKDNDRTPLWDGTLLVYHGEPDKKENLVGTVKAQVKGTEVEAFKKAACSSLLWRCCVATSVRSASSTRS